MVARDSCFQSREKRAVRPTVPRQCNWSTLVQQRLRCAFLRSVVNEAAVGNVGHGELEIRIDQLRVCGLQRIPSTHSPGSDVARVRPVPVQPDVATCLDGMAAAVEDLLDVEPADRVARDRVELQTTDSADTRRTPCSGEGPVTSGGGAARRVCRGAMLRHSIDGLAQERTVRPRRLDARRIAWFDMTFSSSVKASFTDSSPLNISSVWITPPVPNQTSGFSGSGYSSTHGLRPYPPRRTT